MDCSTSSLGIGELGDQLHRAFSSSQGTKLCTVKVIIDQSILIFKTEKTCFSGEDCSKDGEYYVLEVLACQAHVFLSISPSLLAVCS